MNLNRAPEVHVVGKVEGVTPFAISHLLLNKMDGDVHTEGDKKLYPIV